VDELSEVVTARPVLGDLAVGDAKDVNALDAKFPFCDWEVPERAPGAGVADTGRAADDDLLAIRDRVLDVEAQPGKCLPTMLRLPWPSEARGAAGSGGVIDVVVGDELRKASSGSSASKLQLSTGSHHHVLGVIDHVFAFVGSAITLGDAPRCAFTPRRDDRRAGRRMGRLRLRVVGDSELFGSWCREVMSSLR